MVMLHPHKLDTKLQDQVMAEPGGEHLLRCYSCGTCMATCLVSRIYPGFNPRRALRMVMMGMREQVFSDPTIWLCSACDACYPRCPQEIHISDVMRAIKNVALRDGYEPPVAVAHVDDTTCIGCGHCVLSCPYEALSIEIKNVAGEERRVSHVDKSLCVSCGICSATCDVAAITIEEHSDKDVIIEMAAGGWLTNWDQFSSTEPRVLVLKCEYCVRAEADLATLSQLPNNVRVVTIPCSGRIDPDFIHLALAHGVDGVLVAGCIPGECHFQEGNYHARAKMHALGRALDQRGIEPGRVRFVQVGTDERGKLPALIANMLTELKAQQLPAVHQETT